MAGGALAPIQTSTGSAGLSARLASATRNRREELTVSPASRRRMMSRASSKAEGRVRMLAPIAANRASPQPSPHCMMKGPRAMAASVPICSATSTGCHSGSRNRHPAGVSPHSARSRPSIDLLDTADGYGRGRNEELVAEAVREHRGDYVIASKFGNLGLLGDPRFADGRPEYVREACEKSLGRLKTDVIDLYYIHRVDPTVP